MFRQSESKAQYEMGFLNLILFFLVTGLVNGQGIPKMFNKVLNPTDLLTDPQPEVLNSLTSVGIGSDVIERPAKKFLLHVYDQLQRGDALRDTASRKKRKLHAADTVRSFTSKVPIYEGNGRVKLSFNLSNIASSELTNHAELHVRPLRNQQNARHRLKVTIKGDQGRMGEKLTIRSASKSRSYSGYLVFDITDVIQKAMERTVGNTERVVDITVIHRAGEAQENHKGRNQRHGRRARRLSNTARSLSADPKNIHEDDGLLVVYSEDKQFASDFKEHVTNAARNLQIKQSREKRDLSGSSSRDHKRRHDRKGRHCAKHDMWVDFHELGWNRWILYPPRYNAQICGGKCPSPVDWSFDPTNHAILQSLLRLQDKKISRPCCVPSELGAISMLYFERDEIVVRHHEDMMVTSCGCR